MDDRVLCQHCGTRYRDRHTCIGGPSLDGLVNGMTINDLAFYWPPVPLLTPGQLFAAPTATDVPEAER